MRAALFPELKSNQADVLRIEIHSPGNGPRNGAGDSAISVSLGGQETIWIGNMAKNRLGRYEKKIEDDQPSVWLISSGLSELSINPVDWLASNQSRP